MNNPSVDTEHPGNIETLRAWTEEIESEIVEITAAILPLQRRLDAAREKLDLVRRLIHLSAPAQTAVTAQAETSLALQGASPATIEDRMEEILRAAGAPLHIKDLRQALIEAGVPLPGKGDEANLILRLRRATERFVRTGRGTYGLVAWSLPEYSPAPRKKKTRRQRRSTS